jgi:putative ABC transport system substrate-binding protein
VKTGKRQKVAANSTKAKVSSFALCVLLLTHSVPAEAQQPKNHPRIGYLTGGFASGGSPRTDALRQGLRELGYVEGKNIVIEYRYAEGKLDRLPALAAELVRLNVRVIVTGGGGGVTRSAMEATKAIPIVMAQDRDPVGQGFVASLAQPGENVTGLSSLTAGLSGKRLELLKEILPKLSRAAVLGTSTAITNPSLKEVKPAARAIGVELQYLEIVGPKDIETAFRAAAKGRAEGVLVLTGPVINSQRKQIAELAVRNRLPAIFPNPVYVEAGGLMSYSANIVDLYQRAATYVDKILKGTEPADLPVEQPTKFELVINLKTAKALGLKIPAHLLMEASRVIE